MNTIGAAKAAFAFISLLFAPTPPSEPADSAAVGSCPGTGDCCQPNGTPGCSDSECCDLICFIDSGCCQFGWDQNCADLAFGTCDPSACSGFLCPAQGECCAGNGSPGCDDIACCNIVCNEDPFCCDTEWDSQCGTQARNLCTKCAAPACPGDGDCCLANLSPGCDDETCCNLICDEEPFCCDGKWDEICARRANDMCGDAAGDYCNWCPRDGDCCEAHGTPGCDRSACCEAVCAMDDRCCTRYWFAACADLADAVCVPTVCDCATPADFDASGIIDLADAAAFQNCFTGARAGPIQSPCACGDLDGDADVDLDDHAGFAALLPVTP